MKNIIFFASIFTVTVVAACSPKTAPAVAYTPTAPAPDINVLQLEAAKTKYPDATAEALKKGNEIYFGQPCTGCHSAKKITNFSAEELPGIIDHMAKKAKISDEEKDAVLKYVMGVRLAAKQF